jgi:hypothetical protein
VVIFYSLLSITFSIVLALRLHNDLNTLHRCIRGRCRLQKNSTIIIFPASQNPPLPNHEGVIFAHLLRVILKPSYTCFRGLPRRFFSCAWPVLRAPVAACLPAFDGSSLSRPFSLFCLRCARTPASNLATEAFAFPISDLGTNVTLYCTQ